MKYITVLCFILLSSFVNKPPQMKVYNFKDYDLYLTYNPADIFRYFKVDEMHGLNLKDCIAHENSEKNSYIAGWCNISPNTGKPFVLINLTRCTNDLHTIGLIMHELSHLHWLLYEDKLIDHEEQIITAIEEESYKVFQLVRDLQTAN